MKLLTAAVLLGFCGAQDGGPAAPAETEIQALLRQLQSGEASQRKKAEEKILKLGPSVLPALREEEKKLEGVAKERVSAILAKLEIQRARAAARGESLRIKIAAKDQPAADLLEQIEKATGVPIRGEIPDAARASLPDEDLGVWDAIDRICRSGKGLAWIPSEKGVEIRPRTERDPQVLPSGGYALIHHGFVREAGQGNRPSLRGEWSVVGPPGCQASLACVTCSVATDDRGTDLLKAAPSGGWSLSFSSQVGGFKILSEPEPESLLYRSLGSLQTLTPHREAALVRLCKGEVVVRVILGFRKVGEIRGPDLRPKGRVKTAAFEMVVHGVDASEGRVLMDLEVTDFRGAGLKVGRTFYPESCGRVILRDAGGRDIGADVSPSTGTMVAGGMGPPTQESTRYEVKGTLDGDASLSSVELWEPSATEEIRIPFEFKDVPIRSR